MEINHEKTLKELQGIITCIELIYYDEPFTSAAMDFINGKVKANVK